MEEPLHEVPQNLQMLVRLVVRGFYTIEDILIIDMLVRNFCKLLKLDEESMHVCKSFVEIIHHIWGKIVLKNRYMMLSVQYDLICSIRSYLFILRYNN